jgi:hypothetical protein
MVCNVHNTHNTGNQENIIFIAKMFTSRFIFLTVQIVKMLDVRFQQLLKSLRLFDEGF